MAAKPCPHFGYVVCDCPPRADGERYRAALVSIAHSDSEPYPPTASNLRTRAYVALQPGANGG